MAFGFKVTLRTKLPEYGSRLDGDLWDVVNKTAHDAIGVAKTLVLVDTGATKNSIDIQESDRRHLWVRVGPTTFYSIFIELGTRNFPGVPFMVPGLEKQRAAFNRAVGQVLERV